MMVIMVKLVCFQGYKVPPPPPIPFGFLGSFTRLDKKIKGEKKKRKRGKEKLIKEKGKNNYRRKEKEVRE